MSKKGKKKRWGKFQLKLTIGALIAAVLGICIRTAIINKHSGETNYSDAPKITSYEEMSKLQPYSGKILMQGTLSGTEYGFYDKYGDIVMAEKPTVEEKFIYSEFKISRPEQVVSNKSDVEKYNASPQYETKWLNRYYEEQADDLQIFDIPVVAEKFVIVDLTDYGEIYKTKKEIGSLNAIDGPEANVVILATMENGEFVSGNMYIGGDFETAISDAASGIKLICNILLVIWLAICGFVIFSMYIQRYDNLEG